MLVELAALVQTPVASPSATVDAAAVERRLFASSVNEDELLLLSVELDRLTLTEALAAYGNPDDPLLPVGELARLLDLDLDVSPSEHRITGTLGEARRTLLLDLRRGVMRVGGETALVAPADIALSRAEIYIRASALERILPLGFEIIPEALALRIAPREKLPVQARLERIARFRSLNQAFDAELDRPSLVSSPYLLFSPPSFDVAAEVGRDTRTLQSFSTRYDVRFAGDLLYANFQGYVGADERGRPQTARLLFERRSAEARLPLGATRISAGDVFTPALQIGLRSVGGRGFSFTTVPLEEASVFDTIDLRGELPIGFDVELYVNDVLRSGERTPVNGRYEFLNVPLVRGINVIRIVSYGPRGDRSEIVRVVNVGGGQLRKNEAQFEIGMVEQGKTLVELNPSIDDETAAFVASGPRVVGGAAYGLTDGLTLVGGAALYRSIARDTRGLATLGLRTSLGGFAIRSDAAADTTGGVALGVGIAGRPLGISLLLEHLEYRGGFFDETIAALELNRERRRHSAVTVDLALPPIAGRRIPLTFRALRDEFLDGGTGWVASARASATVLNTLFSTGVDYQRHSSATGQVDERFVGSVVASRFVNFQWQLRSTLEFDLRPKTRIRALSFTADRNLSERLAVRLGVGQALAEARDTFGQVGGVLRLPFGELTLSADYSLRNHDWRLAVRFGFGSLFNPLSRRYVMRPPGVAAGGNAALLAFIDRDADGRFGPGDEPAGGVHVRGGRNDVVTDPAGGALLTGLGNAPAAMVSVNPKDIELLYVRNAPTRVQFEPRPGHVVQIPYAIEPVGEVYAQFVTAEKGDTEVGLSALRVRLVKPGREPILGTTEYDGSVVFSEVPLGTYRVELDPVQAKKLRMQLKSDVTVEVTPETTVEVKGTVEFGG